VVYCKSTAMLASSGWPQNRIGFSRFYGDCDTRAVSFFMTYKKMLLMLTYLAAVLRLFWLMGNVSTHALAQVN
jgi:hypothetical protein